MEGPAPIKALTTVAAPDATSGGLPARYPIELAVYRLMTRLARPMAGLVLAFRARHGKEDPARHRERVGFASTARPQGLLVWVHAASVGEASAILPLLSALVERRPDLHILLTTGTVTSTRFVADRLPPRVVHQLVPLDSPAFVARFLDHWRPCLAVLTEQEVWPNLVIETHARGIPVTLVNARMSERSFARWQSNSRVARALFSRLTLVLAQNDLFATRFTDLGAPHAIVAGNLKIDAPPPPVDKTAFYALDTALSGRPRLVAASTHDGEDMVIAAAHRQLARRFDGFCTIIAPRHPHRGPAIAEALAAEGFRVARRSLGELPGPTTDIYVADTIGELGTLYALTSIAFIGGSLVARGGQNPIEAVRHGAAVLTGPSTFNFEDATRVLLEGGGATQVASADDIAQRTAQLLGDPAGLADTRERALRALNTLSGALERTLAALLPLVPQPVEDVSRAS
jgi:3-deoxy-D-manno-octulosonic-acid transferase